MNTCNPLIQRRSLLAAAAAAVTLPVVAAVPNSATAETDADRIVTPPAGKRILLSCKLGMTNSKDASGNPVSLADRLSMAADAGFDGLVWTGRRSLRRSKPATRSARPVSSFTMRLITPIGASD